jgi:hypothetical protein
MKAKKLTAAERKWLEKVQAVLDECPSDRLEAFTIGDPDVTIFDGSRTAEIDKALTKSGFSTDFCAAVESTGSDLFHLKFPFTVHSTAG